MMQSGEYATPPRPLTSVAATDADEQCNAFQVICDQRGQPQWCMSTATALFHSDPEWQGCLRRDEFAQRNMLCRPIPGSPEARKPQRFVPREFADEDCTRAIIWANQKGFSNPQKDVVRDALSVVARENGYDPLRDYLQSLKWDGQPRIGSWLVKYLGVEETKYVLEVGRCWLVSAVARALAPGCKVDSCLILEGPQGGGKSTVLRILAGTSYFGDNLPDLSNKDASSYLRGKWIIELSELAALGRSSFEQTKAFITRQEERYRPPCGRNEIVELRRCVFAGTTNLDDYLRDPTGNRRFWPVRVGEIDLEALEQDRKQLWAEAVAAYNDGAIWWLEGDVVSLAAHEQASRGEDDPWQGLVEAYCHRKDVVAIKSILSDAIQLSHDQMERRHSNRVKHMIVKLGYQHDGQFTSGELKGLGRYVRTRQ